MNLEDFEYKRSGRGYKVLVSCENCQDEWWEKWSAVKDGGKNYCSYDCHNESRRSGVLDGYETRMVHDGKRNNKEVKVFCGYCGDPTWKRWGRAKKRYEDGRELFCDQVCAGKYQTENASQVGKENAGFSWSESGGRWVAYWIDEKTYKKKHTTKAKWLWEMNYGKVPKGYWVVYKDKNPRNCELENLKLISRGERMSEALRGHEVSDEARKNMSKAHMGKVLSEEHKAAIGKATKKMWENGVFDDPKIREAYARQGRSTKGSKRTDEQRQKMSEARKGKFPSQLHTEEALEKRRKKLLGRSLTEEHKRKIGKAHKGRTFTQEHLDNLSIAGRNRKDIKGENSRWWKGGKADNVYSDDFTPYLKQKIRRRDGHECRCCEENVYRQKRRSCSSY